VLSLTEFVFDLPDGADLGPWAANRLRGVLGKSLRALACTTHLNTCARCSLQQACAYHVCFETAAPDGSRFHEAGQEAPRPYVVRTRAMTHGARTLRFELVLMGMAAQAFPYFALAVKEWERPGMGPGHSGSRLQQVRALHPLDLAPQRQHVIYDTSNMVLRMPDWQVTAADLQRTADALPAEELRVRFLTPTRLKLRGEWIHAAPPFHALVAALLRRLEALHIYHGLPTWWAEAGARDEETAAPEQHDARGLIGLSDGVELVSWEGHSESRERYSYRQRQRMEFEGFVGEAIYRGDLRPFRPLLKLGELVHVGKGAVFGLGEYQMAANQAPG
jgi:hypothetical protein